MGRTNPTFRDVLDDVRARWRPFRRGLRREDQARFDDLLEKAGAHADAAGYANPTDPVTAVLLSVLLEQQAQLDALADRLASVEARLDGVEDRLGEVETTLAGVETDARLAGAEAEARLTGLAGRVDALEARVDGVAPPDERAPADGDDQAREDLAAAIDAFYR